MSDTLKIMVREAKTERRALTREEAYALEAAGWGHSRVAEDAGEFLESIGMLRDTYQSSKNLDLCIYGSAEFRHDVVRDAYVGEIEAWHAQGIGYIRGDGYLKYNQELVTNGRKILNDKEIILEVVKGD